MNTLELFNQTMEASTNLALATSVNDMPNVRIVSFCYDEAKGGTAYFFTDREDPKNVEFAKNNKIALTTIPDKGIAHIRSKDAEIQKCDLPMETLEKLYLEKAPELINQMKAMGSSAVFYEIHIRNAVLVTGMDNGERISFI